MPSDLSDYLSYSSQIGTFIRTPQSHAGLDGMRTKSVYAFSRTVAAKKWPLRGSGHRRLPCGSPIDGLKSIAQGKGAHIDKELSMLAR